MAEKSKNESLSQKHDKKNDLTTSPRSGNKRHRSERHSQSPGDEYAALKIKCQLMEDNAKKATAAVEREKERRKTLEAQVTQDKEQRQQLEVQVQRLQTEREERAKELIEKAAALELKNNDDDTTNEMELESDADDDIDQFADIAIMAKQVADGTVALAPIADVVRHRVLLPFTLPLTDLETEKYTKPCRLMTALWSNMQSKSVAFGDLYVTHMDSRTFRTILSVDPKTIARFEKLVALIQKFDAAFSLDSDCAYGPVFTAAGGKSFRLISDSRMPFFYQRKKCFTAVDERFTIAKKIIFKLFGVQCNMLTALAASQPNWSTTGALQASYLGREFQADGVLLLIICGDKNTIAFNLEEVKEINRAGGNLNRDGTRPNERHDYSVDVTETLTLVFVSGNRAHAIFKAYVREWELQGTEPIVKILIFGIKLPLSTRTRTFADQQKKIHAQINNFNGAQQ